MTAPDRPTPDAHAAHREAMAKALAEHQSFGWNGDSAYVCRCGHVLARPEWVDSRGPWLVHLAAALVAAGYGPVAEIAAERDRALAVIGADDRLDNWNRLLERAERAEAERDQARARLAAVEVLAEKWEAADGEPVSTEGLTALNVTNRCGRELRAILDRDRADRIEGDHV